MLLMILFVSGVVFVVLVLSSSLFVWAWPKETLSQDPDAGFGNKVKFSSELRTKLN